MNPFQSLDRNGGEEPWRYLERYDVPVTAFIPEGTSGTGGLLLSC